MPDTERTVWYHLHVESNESQIHRSRKYSEWRLSGAEESWKWGNVDQRV